MFLYLKKSYKLLSSEFVKKIPLITLGYIALSLIETIGIVLIFPITALIIDPVSVLNFSLYQRISAYLPENFIINSMVFLPPLMILIFVLKNVLAIIISRWQINLINSQASNISVDLFKRYIKMPYLESLNKDNGHFNFTILSAGSILYNAYITPFLLLFAESITILGLLCILVAVSPKAAVVSFVLTSALGSVTFLMSKGKLKEAGVENRLYGELLVQTIKETFSNFKEFKVLGRESFFSDRFTYGRERSKISQSRQMIFIMLNRHLIEILLFLTTALISYIVISNNSKAVAIAQISLYGMIIIRLIPAATRIFSSLQTMKTAESAIDLLTEEYRCFSNNQIVQSPLIDQILIDKPTIVFNKMCFSYPGQTKTTLTDISFKIKPNTAIGIVGKTGSGKTTLVDILLGLIPVSDGSVCVNDYSINDILPIWIKRVGYVPQKVSFLSSTLMENIAYGIPKNEININRIKEVISIAQLDEDIEKFEHGINTLILEDGVNLSGGQKQRVGLARALYDNPSILVLDEATSALDVETEAKISTAMENMKKDCTLVIIAHRLSTIRNCDNILYLDKGSLIGQGTFEDLSLENKKFMNLIKLSEFKK